MTTEPRAATSRRDAYSQATRQAVLDSARRQFVQFGYTSTTLAKVAADAGVTRGAVYHHFADKAALFEALVDLLGEEVTVASQRFLADTPDTWDAAILAFDDFLSRSAQEDYARIVWQEGPVALGWERFKASQERHGLRVTEEFVRMLAEEGRLRPGLPLETATRLFYAAIGESGMAIASAPARRRQQVHQECVELLVGFMQSVAVEPG